MSSHEIVKDITLPWAFPIMIAIKKDAQPRFCVEYPALNQVMKPDRWPIPHVNQVLDYLSGSKFFKNLDLFSAY